jgi:uncharacterized protein YndB with AHSA1/START domain
MANELMDISTSTEGLLISRLFDAPRELVFQLWTDPESLSRWWGRPIEGDYLEVSAPERLLWVMNKEDLRQNKELELSYTVTFLEEKGRTRLMLKVQVLYCIPEIALAMDLLLFGLSRAWGEGLSRLQAEVLASRIVTSEPDPWVVNRIL